MIYTYRYLGEHEKKQAEIRLQEHFKVDGFIVEGVDNLIKFLRKNDNYKFRIYVIGCYDEEVGIKPMTEFYLESENLIRSAFIKGDYHKDIMFQDRETRTAEILMDRHDIKRSGRNVIYYANRESKQLKFDEIKLLLDYCSYDDFNVKLDKEHDSISFKNLQHYHDVRMRSKIMSASKK